MTGAGWWLLIAAACVLAGTVMLVLDQHRTRAAPPLGPEPAPEPEPVSLFEPYPKETPRG